jgi:hypothetical protein
VRHALPVAPVGQLRDASVHLRRTNRGAATIFFQLAARAVGCFVKASSSTCMWTCCTMGVRRVLQQAPRMMAHGEGPCASGAIFQRCILTHCWPSPRAAEARPGAVCVRRPPPRAKVRATATRTQPLTANAHELMLCVCVCSRAGRATDGPPLPPPLHRGPRHRRLLSAAAHRPPPPPRPPPPHASLVIVVLAPRSQC